MPTSIFYPRLSSLVQLDFLPEQLGFVNNGLDLIFDDLYYRDLQVSQSARGDSAFYSLTVMSKKRIDFELPGTGINLVLNPAHIPGNFSEFPIKLSYEWPILGYIKGFDLSEFSFTPSAIYELALQILNLSEAELVNRALGVFIDAPTPINQFVDDVNAFYGSSIPYPTGPNPIQEVVNSINGQPLLQGAAVAIFATYIYDAINEGNALEKMDEFFSSLFVMPTKEYLLNLVKPRINASLNLSVGIEFPRNILTPLTAPLHLGGVPLGPSFKTMLVFDNSAGETFSFSTESGIGYNTDIVANLDHPSQIGELPLGITLSGAKLDISKTTNIPEATQDGRPDDFMGVFVKECTISLPSFIKDDVSNPNPPGVGIVGKNLLIGTGGISGTIGLETTGPGLYKKFGDNLQVGFNSFDITLRQNAVISSNVAGYMLIPGFKDAAGNDAKIDIAVHFGQGGEFSVTAKEDQGIKLIKLPGIFDMVLDMVSVGRTGGRWYIAVSGKIDIANQGGTIGKFLPDAIEIQKLIIWENGDIELEGGKIILPKALSLKIGPVELSVSALGMGSYEQMHGGNLRKYKYITFDGGVSIDPGGVDVSGNGVTFYFTVDNDLYGGLSALHTFVRIQSIAIDLVIPGDAKPENAALLLKGYLAMKNPENGGSGTEYAGGIDFTLPKLKMGGSAAMRLNPKIPAFLVDVGLEISTPILLGATGLGIYGFRALIGQKYVATKAAAGVADDNPWWMYYKAKIAPDYKEGIQASKFSQEDGFSLGAGVSLATAADAGKAFSSKLFFLLSLPNVFLLQGQAAILKERIGLDTTTDPPFYALLAISNTSIEAALGANFKIPDTGTNAGKIVTLDALVEMGYFWGNSSSWYINIGKETPENQRIRARILDLFNVYFFTMISSSGIRMGAGASWELNKKFGPLKAELKAYLDTRGQISFKPKQVGGSIALGGSVGLSIFGFGFHFSVACGLAAEAPKPFSVAGYLEVCVRVLKKDRCAKFNFSWVFDTTLDLSEISLLNPQLADSAKALNIQTQESYPLRITAGATMPNINDLEDFIIPMDSYIDIEFVKGVLPSTSVKNDFGGNTMGAKYQDYVSPQKAKYKRVRHEYHLHSVDVKYWDNGTSSWLPYDVYAAATPMAIAPFITTSLSGLKKGYWQYQQPNLHNKLRILAQSPLSFASQGSGDLVMEDLGITTESIFCAPAQSIWKCTQFQQFYRDDFGHNSLGRPVVRANQWIHYPHVVFRLVGADGEIYPMPWAGFTGGLRVNSGTQLEITFLDSTVKIKTQMLVLTLGATVKFYQKVQVGTDSAGLPIFDYQLVQTDYIAPGGTGDINYDDLSQPIDRIVIEPGVCQPIDPREEKEGRPGEEVVCAIILYQICFITFSDAIYGETFPTITDVQTEVDTLINAFNHSIHPVWRPDTHYAIKLRTEDKLMEDDSYSVLTSHAKDYVIAFKTVGPMGHYHAYLNNAGSPDVLDGYSDLAADDREAEFKLAKLQPYIDFPKCYPNADGQLINAKPLFYLDPQLNMFYTQNYVYSMYSDWDSYGTKDKVWSSMEALIKDPAPDPAITPPAPVPSGWAQNFFPIISEDVTILNNMMVTGGPCAITTAIEPMGVASEFVLPALEPLKLYTAVFNARYRRDSDPGDIVREIHKYGFQTSRYANFAEQVQSWILLEDGLGAIVKDAVFTVSRAWDNLTQVAVAKSILDGTMALDHPLRSQFAHEYNRLIEGALQMEALDPPVTTEFNILHDTTSGRVLGILIRNPEPFNDPKLPMTELAQTIQLSVNGGPVNAYKAVFSKDTSCMFVTNTNNTMNIPTGTTLDFEFEFKLWNGQAYVSVAAENVTFNLPTL